MEVVKMDIENLLRKLYLFFDQIYESEDMHLQLISMRKDGDSKAGLELSKAELYWLEIIIMKELEKFKR